jgi:hypothetical protein
MDETTQDGARRARQVSGVIVADGKVRTAGARDLLKRDDREGQDERAERAQRRRAGWGLAALLGAMFLGNVDVAIANVAGPSIRAGLHATGGQLELIVSGYTLAYARA